MAPTINHTADLPQDFLHQSHKIRKPLVEKMRRDRINNCIEELKALLGPQMVNQQPDSKMEKADILEMTVCLLRRHLQSQTTPVSTDATRRVISQAEDSILISEDVVKPDRLRNQIRHLSTCVEHRSTWEQQSLCFSVQPNDSKDFKAAKSAPWRPW